MQREVALLGIEDLTALMGALYLVGAKNEVQVILQGRYLVFRKKLGVYIKYQFGLTYF